jgi:uncharacterized cupin superfamily protein
MKTGKNWKAAYITEVPPLKPSYMKGWHSIRHFLGIKAFGINAVTKIDGTDNALILEHTEKDSGQEELFIVMEGKAEFAIDGEKVLIPEGTAIAVQPEASRSAVALQFPTTLLIVGGSPGKPYEPPSWEKI